ncbi:TPA: IcmT/TraK family protein [Yersinia enterocolitica]
MNNDYCNWLDAGRAVTIFGIPVLVYLVFIVWFLWPSMLMFLFCVGLLVFYKLLAFFGYPLTVVLQRLLHRLRGNTITGRPWWYRKFFE